MFVFVLFFFISFWVIRRFYRSQRLVNLQFGFSVRFGFSSDSSFSIWFSPGSRTVQFQVLVCYGFGTDSTRLEVWFGLDSSIQCWFGPRFRTWSTFSQLGQTESTQSTDGEL
ncbi:hypothetical protein HanPI659440_Chr17g0665921 [Helianthus annuus]|nr:hypothetical protein HanPI659440_Chr17g0665921 [Helianthus annuus]